MIVFLCVVVAVVCTLCAMHTRVCVWSRRTRGEQRRRRRVVRFDPPSFSRIITCPYNMRCVRRLVVVVYVLLCLMFFCVCPATIETPEISAV